MTASLGEHGLISDTRSAALTSADGTLVWWCPYQFDADPALTRLLDPSGAAVGVGPGVAHSQSYIDGTLDLRTTLEGTESLLELTDIMWSGRIVRLLRVLRGPADVVVTVAPGRAREISAWSDGVAFDGVVVRCGAPFTLGSVATATTRLDAGEAMVLTIDPPGAPHEPVTVDGFDRLAHRTSLQWRRTLGEPEVRGRWGPAAARSALVVRALCGDVGAPVLFPVTSLPRVVGGERNADGRVVSPVVVAAWASACAEAGLVEQADAAVTWMAAALDADPPLPLVLGLDGGPPATEATLPGLAGWRGSQPVVMGSNLGERVSVEPAAAVVAALAHLARGPASTEALAQWHRVETHADWLSERWSDPDASVWGLEPRDRRWTASHLSVRHALSTAAASATSRNPLDLSAAGWRSAARAIEDWLLGAAVDPGGVLRAGTGSGLRDSADAGLVRVADWGPWPADDTVVRNTLAKVEERLGEGPWIHLYPPEFDDAMTGTEPPSVTATLWFARALALAGRWDEAHLRMEAAVDLAGSLHLLSESVDVVSRSPLGNRPSSSAHVALISAALALSDAPA